MFEEVLKRTLYHPIYCLNTSTGMRFTPFLRIGVSALFFLQYKRLTWRRSIDAARPRHQLATTFFRQVCPLFNVKLVTYSF